MKKLQSVSLFATAGVLALTTAVYMPGFYATADAASMTASTGTACVTLTDNVLSNDTFGKLDGGKLVGSCSYKLGAMDEGQDITIANGAKITLEVNDETNLEGIDFEVEADSSLTISGKNGAFDTVKITSAGTLSLTDASLDSAEVTVEITDGTATLSGETVIGELKVTDGTVTLSDETTIDELNITGGVVTIKDDSVVGDDITNTSGVLYIEGGTIDGDISNLGNARATGGVYKKSGDMTKSAVESIRDDITKYSVYDDGEGYLHLEETLTADAITFKDITVAEDTQFDLASEEYAPTTSTDSATGFTYAINYLDDTDASADFTIAGTKVTPSKSGTYKIVATSTFDTTVSKEATLTVDSTLATFALKLNSGTANAVKKYVDADTIYESDSEVTLYNGHTLILDYDINDSSDVVYSYEADTAMVTVAKDDSKISIKAIAAGETEVTVTATSTDGKTAKSIKLSFTIYDQVKAANLAVNTQLFSVGDTAEIKNLINLVNADGLNTEALVYSIETPADASVDVDNEAGTITFVSKRDASNTPAVTVKVEDTFAKTAAATKAAEFFVMDESDFVVTDGAGMLETVIADTLYSVTFNEDSDEELVISSALTGTLATNVDTYNGGVAEEEDKLAPTFSYELITINDEDEEVALESSDYVSLTVNEDGTVTVTPGLATNDDDPIYIRISTSEDVAQHISINVISHLTGASLYNTAEEAAVVTATLDEGLNNIVEKSADLTLTAGQTTNFQVAAISTSANLEVSATANSSNVTLIEDSDTAFSIQANTAGEAVVTVIARGDHDEKITFTLNVTIEEAQEEPVNPETVVDGVYVIQSGLNYDKVVDVTGASVNDGANVQLYTANSTIAQKFIFRYDDNGYYTIENLKSGKVLTVNGTNVAQATDTGADAQLWQVIELDNGHVSIVSKSTGLYLDVYHGETADSTNIQVSTGNGTLSQQFSLGTVSQFADEPVLADGTYTIGTTLKDGMMLDVAGNSTKNYANVQLYTSNGTTAQDFELEYNGDGFYTIYTNRDANMVLDVSGAGTKNGTNIQQYQANGTIAQQWMVVDNGDGTYSLASRCNGLYLDIQYGHTTDNTNVWLYESNGSNAQKFFFTSADASEDDSEETE